MTNAKFLETTNSMFFIEGAVGIGSLGGNLISSYILSAIGVNGVFLVSSGMDLAAFLFVYFFITESLNVKHERQEVSKKYLQQQ